MYGDVGTLAADGALLMGDDARVSTRELTAGSCDIAPRALTYEVQTVYVDALSAVSGTFRLGFEGKASAAIASDADAPAFRDALESLDTIETVAVARFAVDAGLGLYGWKVTFQHHVHESAARGAGNLALLDVASTSLSPSTTAAVRVVEDVAGTNPFAYVISGLSPGVPYFARVSAYNAEGYGPGRARRRRSASPGRRRRRSRRSARARRSRSRGARRPTTAATRSTATCSSGSRRRA